MGRPCKRGRHRMDGPGRLVARQDSGALPSVRVCVAGPPSPGGERPSQRRQHMAPYHQLVLDDSGGVGPDARHRDLTSATATRAVRPPVVPHRGPRSGAARSPAASEGIPGCESRRGESRQRLPPSPRDLRGAGSRARNPRVRRPAADRASRGMRHQERLAHAGRNRTGHEQHVRMPRGCRDRETEALEVVVGVGGGPEFVLAPIA